MALKSRTGDEVSGPRTITNLPVATIDVRGTERRYRSEHSAVTVKSLGLIAGPENMFVLEGEAVFIRKDIDNSTRRKLGMKYSNGCISSFVGEPYDENETIDDFLSRYKFAGIARTSYMIKDGVGGSAQIAVQVGGLATIINNSQKVLRLGDPIYLTIPGFHPKDWNGSSFFSCPDKMLPVFGPKQTKTLTSIVNSSLSHIAYGEPATSEDGMQFNRSLLESIMGFGTLIMVVMQSLGRCKIETDPSKFLDIPDFDNTSKDKFKTELKVLSEFYQKHLTPTSGKEGDAFVRYLLPGSTMRQSTDIMDSYYLDENLIGRPADSQSTSEVHKLLFMTRNWVPNLCDILTNALAGHRGLFVGTMVSEIAQHGEKADVKLAV